MKFFKASEESIWTETSKSAQNKPQEYLVLCQHKIEDENWHQCAKRWKGWPCYWISGKAYPLNTTFSAAFVDEDGSILEPPCMHPMPEVHTYQISILQPQKLLTSWRIWRQYASLGHYIQSMIDMICQAATKMSDTYVLCLLFLWKIEEDILFAPTLVWKRFLQK